MSITLPTEGDGDWDTTLNTALTDLDTRLTAVENATVLEPVESVNGDPGPDVILLLDSIVDVAAQPVIVDQDTDEILSQPEQGDVVQWDQTTGLWVTGRPEVVADHNHDDRYEPLGSSPVNFVPGFVYDSGSESIPADLPLGVIIYDVANPAAVVVTYNTSSTLKPPAQVTGLASSSVTQTNATLTWDAMTTTDPVGGQAATKYRVYKDTLFVREVTGAVTTTFTTLTPGTSPSFTVSAVNDDGEGVQSSALVVAMDAASDVPGAPSNLRTTAVTETTIDLAWDVETPDPFEATTGYNVYETGSVSPVNSTLIPAGTLSLHIIGLTGSTDYEYTVRAVNAIGESVDSTSLPVTTDTVTSSGETIRSDSVLDYWGINAKISYGSGTVYGDNPTPYVNTDACVDYLIDGGARIWREKCALTGSARDRQRHAMPVLAASGVRWHSTIGVLSDVKSSSEAAVRTWAHDTVRDVLAEFAGYYLTNAPVPGVMESVLYSVGGPNEIDNSALNGANWARNAYILQHELWDQMRLGSLVPSYVTTFANVKILAPSIRSNIVGSTAIQNAVSANITGEGFISDWFDTINPHKYQGGVNPSQAEIQESLDAWSSINRNDVGADFTECGYNSMNYDSDSNYIGGGVNHTGAPKVPPWVMGVYVPKALATFAAAGCGYYIHELLDDADPATTFNIQSHFGMISMQGSTTAASPPSGWLPKPSWYAMRRMANLLRDRSDLLVAPSFTPTDLPHTISGVSGAGVNFKKLVTQKSNGRWYMLIWREVDVFNNSETSAGSAISVANVDVDITVPQARTYNTFKPNDATAGSPNGTTDEFCTATPSESGTVTAGGTFTIPLSGNLKIIEIY